MSELPVVTYGFEATFDLRDLGSCFPGATLRSGKSRLVASWAPDRVAAAYDFGALAFVNVAADDRTEILRAIREKVATREPHAPLEEEFLIEIRAGAPEHGEVLFDRVVVPRLDESVVDLVTLVLAQSVTIDYYKSDLAAIVSAIGRWTDRLARTGRIGGPRRELVRFVASSMAARNEITEALALLDRPAVTWEVAALHRLHRDLAAMLEIDERFRSLEHRIGSLQDTLGLLLDLVSAQRALALELTIVALIAVEIALSLFGRL